MNSLFKQLTFISLILLSNIAQAALSTGMVNDFQSGTVEGWVHPPRSSNPPVNKANDGPMGTGDNSLWINAHGEGGPGSRLLAINRSNPWTGALNPGISGLEMDLKHINAPDLHIRIAISDSAGPAGTWYASSIAHHLSTLNSDNWEHASFSFADLALVSGSASLASVLSNIAEIRILHSVANDFKGDSISGVFAVDNISAVPVPGAIWLFASALGLLGIRRRF
jgi:hypothetical protein